MVLSLEREGRWHDCFGPRDLTVGHFLILSKVVAPSFRRAYSATQVCIVTFSAFASVRIPDQLH